MIIWVNSYTIIRRAIIALWRPGLAIDEAAEGVGPGLGGGWQLVHGGGVAFLTLAQAQPGGQQQGVGGRRMGERELGFIKYTKNRINSKFKYYIFLTLDTADFISLSVTC